MSGIEAVVFTVVAGVIAISGIALMVLLIGSLFFGRDWLDGGGPDDV